MVEGVEVIWDARNSKIWDLCLDSRGVQVRGLGFGVSG